MSRFEMVGYAPIAWPLECPRDMACRVYEDGGIWPRYVMPDMKTAIETLDQFQPANVPAEPECDCGLKISHRGFCAFGGR